MGKTESATRPLVTVALEDYYQVAAFNHLIQRGQWYRFEPRLERGTHRTLDLLDGHGVQATFFVSGWVADLLPELVREVSDRGHEIASKGYYHRSIRQMSPSEFREDLARTREVLQRASGQRILGYRVADRWFGPADLWALDVLAESGYEYDSSIGPVLRNFSAEPWRRFLHAHHFGERTLWEFPISTAALFGWLIPVAGGNYFRQFPAGLVRRAVAHWQRSYAAPFVMYFHTWELDPDQPKISAAPFYQRIRQYRHLDRMPEILGYYLGRYRFTGIADFLGLSTGAAPRSSPAAAPHRSPALSAARQELNEHRFSPPGDHPAGTRTPVTVVVPCYHEELILPYLANTLSSVEHALCDRFDLEFIFVDDGSQDGTWSALQQLFGLRPNCRLVRHERNRGVAAGILTGIEQAANEIVCSIDCDCTYDPHELGRMIPLLEPGVALVTASPYHPLGGVRNVPVWRLALSRTLSAAYRLVLRNKLRTYTSCFRVYRRSVTRNLRLHYSGFLGVVELLSRLDLAGARIVEFPTVLEVRMLGRSKMKILMTILGHLRLLSRLAWLRLFRPAPAPIDPPADAARERAPVEYSAL